MMAAHLETLSLALLVALAGCEGIISDPGGAPPQDRPPPGTDPEVLCAAGIPTVSPRPLRRLTPEQYVNTMRDLLGDPGFSPDVDDDAPILTERGVRQLRASAELAITRRDDWTRPVIPCDLGGPADDACAAALLDGFGARAFRRPLTADEREWLLGVYGDAKTALSFAEAIEVLVEVILQSPQVVYLPETGVTRDGLPTNVRQLTDHEVASRLSYFLWDTMPDDALFDAAARGELGATEGIRAQAERMLADPRAEATIQDFFWTFLQLNGGRLHHALEDTAKDAELFPEYDAELRAAMRTELEAFVHRVFFEENGSFEQLMLDNHAYVNGPLAALYGVEGGPTAADDWRWVELPATERAGLLTRAAFLTVFAAANVHSPIRRGVFVIEQVLCNDLGEPPPNASDVPVEGGTVDDGSGATVVRSVRQDVEARTTGETCTVCHSVINPTGFAFENYDAIGRFRTEELGTGLPLDATGRIQGSDVDGEVHGALELSRELTRSDRVRSCFADRWMTRAMGQAPGELDACALDAARARFRDTGSLRELVLAIVESDAFRYVGTAVAE
jgi:hypothetical protein